MKGRGESFSLLDFSSSLLEYSVTNLQEVITKKIQLNKVNRSDRTVERTL